VRARWVVVFCAVVATAVAACGSSDGGSSSTGGGSTSGGGTKPSGDPVKIAFIVDHTGLPGNNFGELTVGAKAAATYINSKLGGVKGRPVQVTDCDSKNDPGATLACANQAISDHAVATAGLALQYGTNALARVAQAKIPSMGISASAQEFTDPSSYPIGAGTLGEQYASMRWIATQHPKSVGGLLQDVPANHQFDGVMKSVLKKAGVNAKVTNVFVPPTAVDLSPAAAKLVQANPDWAWVSWANYPAGWKALRDAGYKGHILSMGVAEDISTLNRGGAAGDSLYMPVEFKSFDDMSDPEVKTYRDAMGSSPVARAEFTQFGFATVMTAYEAMKQMNTDITAQNLMAFLAKVPSLHIFMSGTMSSAAAPKDFPALRGIKNVRMVQWKDGKIHALTGALSGSPDG